MGGKKPRCTRILVIRQGQTSLVFLISIIMLSFTRFRFLYKEIEEPRAKNKNRKSADGCIVCESHTGAEVARKIARRKKRQSLSEV